MDISLDSYKIFCTVARTGNMSQAAKELYISQPAVSMAVKQLEERLGGTLLVRTAKGVYLTSEGEVLYRYLDMAMSMIQTAQQKYLERVNLESGEIHIGASDIVLSGYLMKYIEKFSMQYTDIRINVTNKTSFESLELLKSGKIDMCFVNLPIEDDNDLEVIKLIEIRDCLIGGIKYKELSKTGINLSEIENYPLLLLEELSNTRLQLNKFALLNGVALKPIFELASYDILIEFAKINFGLTFIIKEFYGDIIDNKTLFEISVEPKFPPRNIGLVTLKNSPLSNAADKFADMLTEK